MAALVIPPVVIAFRVAFIGVNDERLLTLGELSVGNNVDAFVADEPEAWLFAFARPRVAIGIAEAAIGGGICFSARNDLAHRMIGKVNMVDLTRLRAAAANADERAASPRSARRSGGRAVGSWCPVDRRR